MYKVERRFTFPMGHRLSKNKNRCFSLHGHNVTLLVGVKADKLNDEDMVIDFGLLKKIVNDIIDDWDHCLMLNIKDKELNINKDFSKRLKYFEFDPTAESLSKYLYYEINRKLPYDIDIDYVKFYENENSMATFSLSE